MSARLLCLAACALLGYGGLAHGATKTSDKGSGVAYRWVDEKGVVHYGDSVPPQYSQRESSVLNSQGVEVGKLEAQKTPAQLAEEAKLYQELQRQKQRDAFLLTTYGSVGDIEQLRDVRLEQIKAQRVAAEQYISGLNERLVALQARAMMFKPYNSRSGARRMPDDLAEDLVRTLNELRSQRNALAARDEEESSIRAKFQADIDRYRELNAARAAR